MATMIIVEDESFERNALKNCIDWDLIGVQIVGEAANGAQGLSLAMEAKPDIILTDVNMPVMNAIEMTERLRNVLSDTKVLFLSSYDDFEYARQGINLNIFSYITKPVNENELLRSVKKAVDQITKDELEKKLYDKIKNNYQISLKLAKQAIISRILMGITENEKELAQLNLGWLGGGKFLGEIVSTYDEEKTEMIDEELETLNRNCQRYCSKVTNICITRGILVTIFCFDLPEEGEKMKLLQSAVEDFLKVIDCGALRMEANFDSKGELTASQLYDQIRLRSLSFTVELPEADREKKKGKKQIVSEIEKIIHTQYSSPLTIESIAKTMHFTPNYIGTVFKSLNGISINRYLTNVRIENAKKLLLQQGLSAADISLKCGYDNITYFHTSFKKEVGITPSEYRQKHQNDANG